MSRAAQALTDPHATREERSELAQRAINHADWVQNRLNEFNATGREADRAREALTDIADSLRPYAEGNDSFALDSGGFFGHNTLDLGIQSSFGERMVGHLADDPRIFGTYDSPATFKAALESAGFEVKPLGKGALADVPYESGGGYRINFSDGGLLQYHPEEHSHHGGAYYKISTGKGGIRHYDINGFEKNIRQAR